MDINLYIERVIIEGIPVSPREQRILKVRIESELARLLAENGLPGVAADSNLPYVRTEAVGPSVQSDPISLGQQIARAVYSGISQ